MDFIKKHYEKLLLGLVLAGLVGGLVFMPFYINGDKAAMKEMTDALLFPPQVQPLPDLDLTAKTVVVQRMGSAYLLDLNTTNKLFNPNDWQKTPDGTLIPARATGPQFVVVTNITPLYTVINLDSITTNELGARYVISVERQADKNPGKRHKQPHYVSVGDRPNEAFGLVKVNGQDPANPDSLDVKFTDTGETVSIASGKPYKRIDGYMADFRYDLEKRIFHNRRVGDKVSFGGIDYMVEDINQNEVILMDQSNQKKTTLPFAP
jgi:hypothetical protein